MDNSRFKVQTLMGVPVQGLSPALSKDLIVLPVRVSFHTYPKLHIAITTVLLFGFPLDVLNTTVRWTAASSTVDRHHDGGLIASDRRH